MSKPQLLYASVEEHYKKFPPLGFRETGPEYFNTCAVRLADALTRVQPTVFAGTKRVATWPEKHPTGHYVRSGDSAVSLKFEAAPQNRRLPIRAGDLKVLLEEVLGDGAVVTSPSTIAGKKGIICFEHIPGYGGTGHISLWDGGKVVDGVAPWRAKPISFWGLP
jgi:hypothetical protein